MYYSAILIGDQHSERVKEIAESCDIELKAISHDSTEGKVLVDNLLEFMVLNAYNFPLVLAGYEVIGAGQTAWLDLYEHALKHPHVHWEADHEGS